MRANSGRGFPALWTLKNKKIGKVKKFTFPIFISISRKKPENPVPKWSPGLAAFQ